MKKKEIPFVAYGNDELALKKDAGKFAPCLKCNKKHEIRFGTVDGKESKLLGFISCGKNDYLATLNGKLLLS